MFKKPDRKVLLPTAVPTDFCNYNFTYYIFYTLLIIIYFIAMIFKEDVSSTSCLDTSISEPLSNNNSVATSTALKQKVSISNYCKLLSLCKYYYLIF